MVRATVPSLAKLNLDLRVLHRNGDGYHELRTIFQSINLRDILKVELEPASSTRIDLDSSPDIPDNLVVRSAKIVLNHLRVKARVRFFLRKRIPMGAGLGGGSSNAAAVLIALPALLRRPIPISTLMQLAQDLGSDVPFFLLGGTALGFGRGTELYPLPDQPRHPVLVVSTGVHVSTPEAYQALGREVTNALTWQAESPILGEFQTIAWALAGSNIGGLSVGELPLHNDFEQPVFGIHPRLSSVVRKLKKLGAKPAAMTGSGSALFGVFSGVPEMLAAASHFPAGAAFPARFVSRSQYRTLWRRALGEASELSCFAAKQGGY
jgi:4-diphosphocytidyl-2-C-methyl-D-erythritol kinase